MISAWPEEYNDEPYLSYARILVQQPDPPRTISFEEILKAQFRPLGTWIVVGLGIISVFLGLIGFVQQLSHSLLYALAILVLMLAFGIPLLLSPIIAARRMTKALRYGVQAEAQILRRKHRGNQLYGTVRIYLGTEVIEKECLLSSQHQWVDKLSSKDVIEVLADPERRVPVLFLRVKPHAHTGHEAPVW